MVPPSARSSLLFIARYGERLTGADLSGVASMQGFHGGTGRVCALLLTFLSASNDRPQAMTQLQTGHEVRISSLSCDKNAATNPSTPGLSATLNGRIARQPDARAAYVRTVRTGQVACVTT